MAKRTHENPDIWPQRARFVELLDGALASGATYQQIADALGLKSTRSLENEWRYDRSRTPGRKAIDRMCQFFGVGPWELYGAKPSEDDAEFQAALQLATTAMPFGGQGGNIQDFLTRAEIMEIYRVSQEIARITINRMLPRQ